MVKHMVSATPDPDSGGGNDLPKMRVVCPDCGHHGHPVPSITIERMVRPEMMPQGETGGYRFCSTQTCNVVYYHPVDGATIGKDAVLIRVGIKDPGDEVIVCYCLDISRAHIADEIAKNGRASASAQITSLIDAGKCECQEKSPSGRCCLSDVKSLERLLLVAAAL